MKKSIKNLAIYSFVIFFALVSIPIVARAQEGGIIQCGNPGDAHPVCGWSDLIETLNRLIGYVILYVAIPVSVIVIIVGGITMIFSAGNESKFKRGKEMVQGVAIGLAITFGAWIIVQTIINIFFSTGA